MNAKSKVGLAFLMAALLLINPAGRCVQAETSGAPTHTCCPKKHAPLPEDCGKPGCVYMKPLPIAVATSIESDPREGTPVAVLQMPLIKDVRTIYVPAVPGGLSTIRQRFLSLHQLLI
jgi:hypothetical protein